MVSYIIRVVSGGLLERSMRLSLLALVKYFSGTPNKAINGDGLMTYEYRFSVTSRCSSLGSAVYF